MEKEDIIIERFGLCPSQTNRMAIRQMLENEIQTHSNNEGCGEFLRVLCFMLFFIGEVEDSTLIWKAKTLNMDTGCMIDVGLLCGAGYKQTITFIKDSSIMEDMKLYLEKCHDAGDEFDKEKIIQNFKAYYGSGK